jgi:hypothetical protein
MSILVDNKGRIHFNNMTRGEINHAVSKQCKTDACAEAKQAVALHDLKEVFPVNRYKMSAIARLS